MAAAAAHKRGQSMDSSSTESALGRPFATASDPAQTLDSASLQSVWLDNLLRQVREEVCVFSWISTRMKPYCHYPNTVTSRLCVLQLTERSFS